MSILISLFLLLGVLGFTANAWKNGPNLHSLAWLSILVSVAIWAINGRPGL